MCNVRPCKTSQNGQYLTQSAAHVQSMADKSPRASEAMQSKKPDLNFPTLCSRLISTHTCACTVGAHLTRSGEEPQRQPGMPCWQLEGLILLRSFCANVCCDFWAH